MLHAGLDLSRKRIDVCLLSDQGELIEELACPPDHDGLRGLARRAGAHGEPVVGVIESMTGARFVHDTLESLGWAVEIADAAKVKGLAPLAAKTDRIDARVLALLSQRDLVPAIWLPDPRVREERELARFRLHLVKHRSQLKHRIHSTLMSFGRPCPVSDLFGVAGRELLARLEVPEPWLGNVLASLELIDCLEAQISEINSRLAAGGAEHPYVPRLLTVPGIGSAPGLHDRRRDRRDQPLCLGDEADRLHGPLPAGGAVGRLRPPRPSDQAGSALPALGAARGDHARPSPPRLRGALPAKQAPTRQTARRQGRPGRHRPQADGGDLAHAHPQRVVRSQRRRFSSGGLTALLDLRRERTSNDLVLPDEEAIET